MKNLLVGDDVTYERKIREMIVASRMEHQLSKSEILELYLNSIYLGRSAWGIEMASRRYFGKSAKELSLAEGALQRARSGLAGAYEDDPRLDREGYREIVELLRELGIGSRQ